MDFRAVKLRIQHISTAGHSAAYRYVFINCSVPPPMLSEESFCGVQLACLRYLTFLGRDVAKKGD